MLSTKLKTHELVRSARLRLSLGGETWLKCYREAEYSNRSFTLLLAFNMMLGSSRPASPFLFLLPQGKNIAAEIDRVFSRSFRLISSLAMMMSSMVTVGQNHALKDGDCHECRRVSPGLLPSHLSFFLVVTSAKLIFNVMKFFLKHYWDLA